MPSLLHRLGLVALLALLAATLPAPRPAYALSLVVNSLADDDDGSCSAAPAGDCTLREAINAANASPAADTITFSVSGRITPNSPLPPLSGGGDTIDASNRNHGLVLSGQNMATATPQKIPSHGLRITSANNTIRGLVIIGFPILTGAFGGGSGIYITGVAASGNKIYDNWIGVDTNGSTASPNQYAGVLIDDGASNNEIGGTAAGQPNVISGNTVANVAVQNVSSTNNVISGNRIVGNRIGTNSAGTAAISDPPTGGLEGGIFVERWARDTLIRSNLIGGHVGNSFVAGIKVISDVGEGANADRVPRDTVIVGNRIGVTDSGTQIANRVGVLIAGGITLGALDTVIGDPADLAGGRNYIAGNTVRGIEIQDNQLATGNTLIVGNYIGLAPNGARVANGTAGNSNTGEGIWIGMNAANGATKATVGPGNVFAASRLFHIRVRSSGNIIKGNRIGTSPDGLTTSATSQSNAATVGYGSGAVSVYIEHGTGNLIGGPTAADRNVIASGGATVGGTGAPVLIDPLAASSNNCFGDPCATSGNTIQGNYLGVKANGNEPLITSSTATADIEGLRIRRSTGNTVRGNLVGGLGRGFLLDSGANNNTIAENLIGTTASGATTGTGVPNSQDGILVLGSTGNTFERNVVAFNGTAGNFGIAYHGVRVGTATTSANNNLFNNNNLVSTGIFVGSGILIENSQGVRVSQTTTDRNSDNGITLVSANGNLQPPTLTAPGAGANTISGTVSGCGTGCTIELFTGPTSVTDRNGEGPIFLASTTTNTGNFTLPLAGCLGWVTATARASNNNTSPFSDAVDVSTNTTCTTPTFTLSAAAQPNPRTAEVGTSTEFVHTVSHNSPVPRTYTIVVDADPSQASLFRGWATAPATVTVPANGSAQFSVTVSVPAGTAVNTQDVTRVRVALGNTFSSAQLDRTTATQAVQNPASPAVSAGQTKPLTTGQTTFTHTVTNVGDLAGDFAVVGPNFVGTPPAGWSIASATLGKTRLNGGESTTLTIVVNNPAPLPSNDVSFSFRVRVVGGPQTDPATVDTIDVPVVRSFNFTRVTPSPQTTAVGGSVSFVFNLQNTGNANDTFQVTVPTSLTGFTFSVNPNTNFQLAPGATRAITITANVGPTVASGSYDFTARAAAVGGSGAPAAQTIVSTINVTGGGVPLFVGTPTVTPALADFETATEVQITWNLRNNGNKEAPFSFALEGSLPAGFTQVGTFSDTCPNPVPNTTSGSSCSVTLTVSVAAGLNAGPRTVSIKATADNSPDNPDISAIGTATVTVETVRAVEISAGTPASPPPVTGAPGQEISFTHTVTNVGNATDSFTISLSQSETSWTAEVNPSTISNLARGASAQVTVLVTVPLGVPAETINTVTVTARSNGDNTKSDSAQDQVEVQSVDGADLSPGQTMNAPAGTTVTFTHTLTNTGSTELSYRIEAENSQADWPAPVLDPASPIGPLAPGATVSLVVTVEVPGEASGGISNTTTLRIYAEGATDPAPLLDSEQDVTRVGDPFEVLITPNRSGTALPDSTVVFTHTVTNIGTNPDSYRLTVAESSGLPTFVAPDLVDLGPGESQTISVTIRLPLGLAAGAEAFARVTATSLGQAGVSGSATDEITIGRVAGVDLAAAQVRGVGTSGGQIVLDSLTLRNTGNAVDSFELSFEDVAGVPGGLSLQLNPGTITLGPNDVLRSIGARATVPSSVPEERTRRVRIVARSLFDPSVSDSVIVDVVYQTDAPPPPPPGQRLYLPILAQ